MSAKINITCRKCSLALIFMLFLQSIDAQDFNNLQTILKSNAKNLGKQYTVVVQKGGKNIFLAETDELKLKVPTPIGHASAWISAALVMTFVDQNKLSLDDPIAKYLPDFKKNMKGYITVKHCLTQTTGLDVDAGGVMKAASKNKFLTLEEEAAFYATKKLIVDNPGDAFSYSSVGLNILGRVLEVISKKSFDRLAAERIFRPLGMRTASFFNEDGNAPNPTSGASCSAFDYLNFMQMFANKGMFMGKRVMSENAIQTLLTIHYPDQRIRYSPEGSNGSKYAMGSWVQEINDDGKGNIYSAWGPTGATAWVNLKSNYFAAIFSSELQNGQRLQLIQQLRQLIDEQFE